MNTNEIRAEIIDIMMDNLHQEGTVKLGRSNVDSLFTALYHRDGYGYWGCHPNDLRILARQSAIRVVLANIEHAKSLR